MKRLLLVGVTALCISVVHGQLLTWSPLFPKESDAAQNLVITMDATKGNQGLLNYTPTNDVYVHIGAITNLGSGWSYVPFTWGSTTAAANAVYIGNNKWTYTINGSLRSFFNITNPSEHILKIAILFRNGNGSNVLRNIDGSDMYIPVYDSGLHVRIDHPFSQPKFDPVPEAQNWIVGSNISMTANASKPSAMKLFHNGIEIASQNNVQSLSGNSTVSSTGNQQLVAMAFDGIETKYDTMNIFVSPPGSPVVALPAGLRDGINYEPGDTSVTLVLRAPGKNMVTVIGDFNNWIQNVEHIMNKTPDGKFFWLRIHPLVPGNEYAYQYIVNDSIKIADPYSEKILDPWNDQYITSSTYPALKPYPSGQSGIVSVLQTAEPDYNWAVPVFNRPDKRGLVIYELLVRDFVHAHDWKTITDSLGYFRKLGINAIELMPVNEFEGNISWGYNPDFYFAPDKYYGNKNSFKTFIDSCHQNGIAVILDIALNHSFGLSPMVQLYWDAANNRPAANNPWYNPAAKHAFNVGFDMNHQSHDTRYFTSRVIEHWLQEYKVDGFRFDLSKGFTQVQTCDANGNNCNVGAWGNLDTSRIAIWKRYYDTTQLKSAGSYAILEHFADNAEEKLLADYGMLLWGNMNYYYSQAAKGSTTDWDFSNGIHTVRTWTKPHLVTYMESHDEERIVYRNLTEGNASGNYNIKDTATALKRMEQAAAFLFTIPGPKMLWQFGELGYHYSINYCQNGSISPNCRLDPKPIRWDFLNDPRRKSVFNTYSKLLSLRQHPWYKEVFLSGNIDRSLNSAIKWIKVSSAMDSSDLLVIGNFGITEQVGTVSFQTAGTWFDYLNNTTLTATGSVQNIFLQPGEFRVYVNRNVNNIPMTPVNTIPLKPNELVVKIFPNPATTAIYTDIYLPQAGVTSIQLYNLLGQPVTELYKGFLVQGEQQIQLKVPPVAKGMYYIKVSTRSAEKTVQVIF